jgi:hypothetical protein
MSSNQLESLFQRVLAWPAEARHKLAREMQEIEDQLRRRSNSELVIKEQNVGQSGLAANDEAEAYFRRLHWTW